jgi:hypothetical protein
MSKRNKQKNHYKFQSTKQEGGEASKDAVVVEPVAPDSQSSDQTSQASVAPSTDTADTTDSSSAPAGVDIPVEVVPEEKKEETVTVASPVVAGQPKSKKMAKAFVWGLLVGALIVSVLF